MPTTPPVLGHRPTLRLSSPPAGWSSPCWSSPSVPNAALDAARLDIIHPAPWGRAAGGRTIFDTAASALGPLVIGVLADHLGGNQSGGLDLGPPGNRSGPEQGPSEWRVPAVHRSLGSVPTDMAELVLSDFVATERERVVASLFEWLRIPSISSHPERTADVERSARYCAGLLRAAGLEHVELLATGGPDGGSGRPDANLGGEAPDGGSGDGDPGAPAVYGDWLHAGPGATTVLVYGHHDVQPVDPLDEWTSPPFEPVIVDGECRARGAIDDKGQTLYQIEAVRGLLATRGELPVNLKFLIEGEEEVGSPHFEALLAGAGDRLACDVVVVSDTGMISAEVPSTSVSLRGLVAFDVTLRTGRIDLHSGQWGGTVPNAALHAARLAASLHDERGRVAIPGFYDRVRPLSATEQRSLDAQPFDEATFLGQAGVAFLEGEDGYHPLERVGTRPTAEVVGIRGGYAGPGIKTIVPATAGLKVALRLVPDQRPDEIAAAFRAWLAEAVPAGVEVTVSPEGGVAPALTPIDHPAMGALSRVIQRVWGVAPLFTREGGSGPEEALGRVLDAPVLFLGVSLPEDRFHAPNERMVMSQFWKGMLAAGELLVDLGDR